MASSDAAREVVDVSTLRASWRIVATEDTPRALQLAVSTLMRGLMVGLFLSDHGEAPPAGGQGCGGLDRYDPSSCIKGYFTA